MLTIAGQAVVERSDIRGVFLADPAPARAHHVPGHAGRWPARRSPPCCSCRWSASAGRWAGSAGFAAGVAALALSWAVGTGAYFLFVNLDAVPAADRAAAGLRNPGGPIAAPDFGAALIAVGVWQAVFFIALRGWPVNLLARRSGRLLAGNALVLGLGAAYLCGFAQPGAAGRRTPSARSVAA